MVLTLTAWAAITISLKKGSSYDLRLRTWHCSSTLRVLMAPIGTPVRFNRQHMKRKLLTIIAILFCTVVSFAQNDVTKFLGFPVDGTKADMIKNLKLKGFKLKTVGDDDVLIGRFNGNDVNVYISTEDGKVSRIVVCDKNPMNETDIRIRFNRLCSQFKDNGKYLSLADYSIPDNEDISYEMAVHDKRYEAVFLQLPEGETMEQLQASIWKYVQDNYTPEQFESLTEEMRTKIISDKIEKRINILKNKPVWFMISESYGKYFIVMYYDNEYNRANGEDL